MDCLKVLMSLVADHSGTNTNGFRPNVLLDEGANAKLEQMVFREYHSLMAKSSRVSGTTSGINIKVVRQYKKPQSLI